MAKVEENNVFIPKYIDQRKYTYSHKSYEECSCGGSCQDVYSKDGTSKLYKQCKYCDKITIC